MKKALLPSSIFVFFLLFSINSYACTCNCKWDCTFSKISIKNDFVALVKVIEYSDYLDIENRYGEKRPYSITVEIIKKYKGTEHRKRIKIWGDNGFLCRPYISELTIGSYYLIAPNIINNTSELGNAGDYDFFVCNVDYLEVDFDQKVAIGEYSKWRKNITLAEFERKL